jgi:hypothetical protein
LKGSAGIQTTQFQAVLVCSCFVRPRQAPVCRIRIEIKLITSNIHDDLKFENDYSVLVVVIVAAVEQLDRSVSPSALVWFCFGRVPRFVVTSRPDSALDFFSAWVGR